MRFSYIFFIISVVVLISCKSKNVTDRPISKGKSAQAEQNFIPYYLEAERAKKLYDNKEYEKALENLYEYIELNPEANDIDSILELVKQIRNTISS